MTTKSRNKKIKGIILSGGLGTRLRPLTDTVDKGLLPIGDKPLVEHIIGYFVNAGITNIVLVISHRNGSKFMEAFKDGKHLGLDSLVYVWHPEESIGLPKAIGLAKHAVHPGEHVLAACDVLIENGITSAVEDYRNQSEGARVITFPMENTAGYGWLQTEKDKVLAYPPKDKTRKIPGLIESGYYFFPYDVFEKIDAIPYKKGDETRIWDLFEPYITAGTMFQTPIEGWWCDVGGSIEIYQAAHQRYLDSKTN